MQCHHSPTTRSNLILPRFVIVLVLLGHPRKKSVTTLSITNENPQKYLQSNASYYQRSHPSIKVTFIHHHKNGKQRTDQNSLTSRQSVSLKTASSKLCTRKPPETAFLLLIREQNTLVDARTLRTTVFTRPTIGFEWAKSRIERTSKVVPYPYTQRRRSKQKSVPEAYLPAEAGGGIGQYVPDEYLCPEKEFCCWDSFFWKSIF